MANIDEIINKSLDDIDSIVKSMEEDAKDLNKSEEPSSDISADVPQQTEEGGEEPTQGDEATEEPTEGEGDNEEEVQDDTDEVPDDMNKSLADQLCEDDDVRKALEVSDFLKSLVDGISEVLSNHNDSLSKSLAGTDRATELIAKSFQGIVNSQKSVVQSQANLQKSINDLNRRLNQVENQPLVRKSVSTAREHIIEKSFVGDTATNKPNALSKSDAVEKLTVECANRPELVQDVLALESTGDFRALSGLAKSVLGISNL